MAKLKKAKTRFAPRLATLNRSAVDSGKRGLGAPSGGATIASL